MEKIIEGMASNAYIWVSISLLGKDSIEAFDKLTEEERNPYYALAHQLNIYLSSQGVVIPDE